MPVTTPVAEPTVANKLLLLLQVPPGSDILSVVVPPTHIDIVPVMPESDELIVITFIAVAVPQPLVTV
jgi:hypothetical protein